MTCTDEGMPLFVVGGGDPARLRAHVVAARAIAEPTERAARLYVLGRGLLDCDDASAEVAGDAVAVLLEAMALGSTHAAHDLATIVLQHADCLHDVKLGAVLLARSDGIDY